jgi:uncharacterized glyoxalase superfamily protein PhnB
MSQHSFRAPDMPWISAHLTVRDVGTAADFYNRAFGLEKRNEMPGPDGKLLHAELTWHDGLIMLGPECATEPHRRAPASTGVPSAVGLYLYCPDVDALCARAEKGGAKVLQAPTDMFWGDRVCRLEDPDGHIWSFATHTGKQSAPPW